MKLDKSFVQPVLSGLVKPDSCGILNVFPDGDENVPGDCSVVVLDPNFCHNTSSCSVEKPHRLDCVSISSQTNTNSDLAPASSIIVLNPFFTASKLDVSDFNRFSAVVLNSTL